MSDDDDTSQATAVPVPEADKGWSGQDRRTLIITLGGTLAANLVTVLFVGAAIALVHWSKNRHGDVFVATLWFGGTALLGIFGGIVLIRGLLGTGTSRLTVALGWVFIALGVLYFLFATLLWTGVAAGVK
jgi:hypothetical protein